MESVRFMNKKIIAISVLLAGMLLCSACSMPRSSRLSAKRSSNSVSAANAVNKKQEEEQSTADIPKKDPTVYVIVKNDLQNYQLTLRDLSGASQICYEYTDGTDFFDKYGSDTPISEFSEGRLVVVSRRSNDILGTVSFTDETWSYENIINYSIDEIKNRMDIADTGYQLHENVQVFSDGVQTTLSAVGENDILNVYGIDRTICSIVVATGHGTLSLTNTELFEGGWVNLGTKVYAKITGNMTMELPEGVYDFSVANDGYGDSGEVLIRRDKVTTIDLNDYKGEGPKFCKLTFDVGVDGAILTINGKKINHTKPQELRYGVYTLGVFADGYDAWTKQLVINSPTAKIDILLSEESDTQVASNAEAKASRIQISLIQISLVQRTASRVNPAVMEEILILRMKAKGWQAAKQAPGRVLRQAQAEAARPAVRAAARMRTAQAAHWPMQRSDRRLQALLPAESRQIILKRSQSW